MHHFAYRDGVLHAEDVDLRVLAEEIGTPFYCYSTATLERHYRVMAQAFAGTDHLICYAMKANSNLAVVRHFANLGAGFDLVSGGEIRRGAERPLAGDLGQRDAAAVIHRLNLGQDRRHLSAFGQALG